MTDAELRVLLRDCLTLWEVQASLEQGEEGWEIGAAEGVFSIAPADPALRPARWMLQTPERRMAGRPPRMSPSIAAALSALRNALGAARGERLRIGGA